MKNSILSLLILICSNNLSLANFNYSDQVNLDNRINYLLDNLDSTLELQNTAIALLQKKLVSHQRKQTIQLCVLSATVASVLTWLLAYRFDTFLLTQKHSL